MASSPSIYSYPSPGFAGHSGLDALEQRLRYVFVPTRLISHQRSAAIHKILSPLSEASSSPPTKAPIAAVEAVKPEVDPAKASA